MISTTYGRVHVTFIDRIGHPVTKIHSTGSLISGNGRGSEAHATPTIHSGERREEGETSKLGFNLRASA